MHCIRRRHLLPCVCCWFSLYRSRRCTGWRRENWNIYSLCVGPTYLRNHHKSKLWQIFCTCYLWPSVGPALTALQYVTYFRFSGWRHISHDGSYGASELYAQSASAEGSTSFTSRRVYSNWLDRGQHRTGAESDGVRWPCFSRTTSFVNVHCRNENFVGCEKS